jgi:hypothetical protein
MAKKLPHEIADQRALSVKEACKYISVGRTSFYKLVKSGQILHRAQWLPCKILQHDNH